MLQVYSTNVDVAVDSTVPFNSTIVEKGCTATHSGPSTIELNKAGVYKVDVDGVAAAETTIQLSREGVLLPQATSTGTTLGFTTLIQVPTNCTPVCYSNPVTLSLFNTGAETTFDHINMVVTRIC